MSPRFIEEARDLPLNPFKIGHDAILLNTAVRSPKERDVTDRFGPALAAPACLAALLLVPQQTLAQQAAPSAAATAQPSAATTQPVEAQAQPAPPRAPTPNRFNEVLPSWLRVRGEFRERMEGFDGGGFIEEREDLYWLSRVRLNATVTPSKTFSLQAQVQDARVARKT